MKLIGNLKKQVEETKNKEEAKEVIEKAGMELTDEELDQVAGGGDLSSSGKYYCNQCRKNRGPLGGICSCGGSFTLDEKQWKSVKCNILCRSNQGDF